MNPRTDEDLEDIENEEKEWRETDYRQRHRDIQEPERHY